MQSTISTAFDTEAKFESYKAIIAYCKETAQNSGYEVAVRSSSLQRGYGYLQCHRSGEYREFQGSQSLRHKATTKTTCPFRLVVSRDEEELWSITESHLEHNHRPEPTLRRSFTDPEREVLERYLDLKMSNDMILGAWQTVFPDATLNPS